MTFRLQKDKGKIMNGSDTKRKVTVEHQFDALSKKCIHDELINYRREQYSAHRHIQLSLDGEDDKTALTADISYVNPAFDNIDNYCVDLKGFKCRFSDEHLYVAVRSLKDIDKDIILYSFFKEYSDEEISKTLHINKRTVNYHKNVALGQLASFLVENFNEYRKYECESTKSVI